jgi:signal transduction histidine kinase
VSVECAEALPGLPAAVEVAAYRIVLEALMNVVRHSGARSCVIELSANHQLEVRVTDDGVGISPEAHAGLGLASMRERASELGGTWAVEAAEPHGTRIIAQLPLVSP